MSKIYTHTFKENRLVHLNLGNLASLSPAKRTSVLNSNDEAVPHNNKMGDVAAKEFNDEPIGTAVETIKKESTEIKDNIIESLKSAVKFPFKILGRLITKPVEIVGKPVLSLTKGVANTAVQVTTNVLGVAATAPRIVVDAARIVPRIALVALDKLGVPAGMPSRIIARTKEKALGAIDTANSKIYEISSSVRDKIHGTTDVLA